MTELFVLASENNSNSGAGAEGGLQRLQVSALADPEAEGKAGGLRRLQVFALSDPHGAMALAAI